MPKNWLILQLCHPESPEALQYKKSKEDLGFTVVVLKENEPRGSMAGTLKPWPMSFGY